MMGLPGSLLALTLLHAGVSVGGSTACPTAEAVQHHLAAMVGTSAPEREEETTHRALLSQNEAGLLVTLHARNGAVVAERQFAADVSCADLAAAAAVVIASWQGELVASATTLAPMPPAAPPPPQPKPVPTPWHATLAAAASGTWVSSSAAPGAWLEVALGRANWRIHGVLAAFAQGYHELPLGPGRGAWQRSALALGPRMQWRHGRVWAAADLLAFLGWLRLEGRDLPNALRDSGADVGASLSGRLGLRWGPLSPFLALGVDRSWVERSLTVEPATEATMPAFAGRALLGVSWHLEIFPAQ